MLAAALRGHAGRRPLDDLEERLLDAFTRDVAGDRRVVALAGDLVDLVDVDDAPLALLDVVVGISRYYSRKYTRVTSRSGWRSVSGKEIIRSLS
jgi:hypothetical protein